MDQSNANTHAKRALLELRQRIINGELPGGQRLYEVALAKDLQISRTPVREALSRLAEEGLLDRAPGGGFVVRTFTRSDVIHAIELRGVLEGTVARLAAERGTSADETAPIRETLAALDGCFGRPRDEVDFDRYAELNSHFHAQLASLSASALMVRELERVKSLPFASPSAFVPNRAALQAFRTSLVVAQQQHYAIVAAIEAREGTRAEALAREHARLARGNLDYILDLDAEAIATVGSLALVVD